MSVLTFCLGVGCGLMANRSRASDGWWALAVFFFGSALVLRFLVEVT